MTARGEPRTRDDAELMAIDRQFGGLSVMTIDGRRVDPVIVCRRIDMAFRRAKESA